MTGCSFSVAGDPRPDPRPYVASDLGEPAPVGDAGADALPADLSGPMPILSVSSESAPTSADLTADGTVDWAHWGVLISSDFDHKNGAGLISNYAVVGSAAVAGRYGTNYTAFDWSDGAPHATAQQSTTGVYIGGVNNGFSLTAPADTTERTLQLYISVYRVTGSLRVQLSDGSASDFADSFANQTASTWRLYTMHYRAASPGQTLQITWTETSSFDLTGNITLQAATLR